MLRTVYGDCIEATSGFLPLTGQCAMSDRQDPPKLAALMIR